MKHWIVVFILIATIAIAAESTKPYLVGAHYYAWYSKASWKKVAGEPLVKHYHSMDDDVIAQHLKWASQYGIDFFAVEWSGQNTFGDQAIYKHFAAAPDFKNIKFCIAYDTLSRFRRYEKPPFNFSHERVRDGLVSDFDYLSKRYFSNPNYLKFQGRPVVWFYIARAMQGDWVKALELAREAARKNGFEVYIDGDLLQMSRIDPRRFPYFDAVSLYTLMERKPFEQLGVRTTGDVANIAQDLFTRWAELVPRYKSRSTGKPLAFHPVITPQFMKMHGEFTSPYFLGSEGEFRRMVDIAKSTATFDEFAGTRIVWITSWNEWYEGSAIEPTQDGPSLDRNYGFKLLETIRDVFGSTEASPAQ